jgi:hypothetical protein
MGRFTVALAACALMAGLGASLQAGAKTVKGELVDVQCQMKDAGNKGAGHEDCALSCAKRGAAMGIMAADGVYTITGDYTANKNAKLIEFVSKNVEASGEVTEADGKKTINVASLKLAN